MADNQFRSTGNRVAEAVVTEAAVATAVGGLAFSMSCLVANVSATVFGSDWRLPLTDAVTIGMGAAAVVVSVDLVVIAVRFVKSFITARANRRMVAKVASLPEDDTDA